jgi:hypothetical protein
LRIGGGLSKERFGFPSLFPEAFFFIMPLYKALQAGFNQRAGSFANIEYEANVGKRGTLQGKLGPLKVSGNYIYDPGRG